MKIISFLYTIKPFMEGKKTVTRRFWKDNYAIRFHKGDLIKAYDKNPMYGGKQIGMIRLTKDPYKQSLDEITMNDVLLEGGIWNSIEEFKCLLLKQNKGTEPYVVEFEKL